ncbi:uncharacterized protein LOC143023811 [Oratosquilla oratoria]|uniref:uncharacterized protein LOC143023811 n=1 Tax=Oratosquilla oratoria TaxID=337810 RepID=UPI003F768781
MFELSKSAIQKCKEELDCHVGSVVTDNAANVNKMRKLLEQENELKLVTYGCTAHILNLLAHDLEIDNIKEHVVNIVKYFRDNHYASARYRQEGEQRLVMPQDTRWNTMCNCLKTYIKNWPALMKICEVDREQIDVRVREKVSNLTLKRSAEDLLARLEPIAVALDKAQSDKCTIAEAVNMWKELITTLSNGRDALTAVRKRYDQVITQAHLLANLIHPSLQGKLLSEEVNNAMDYANERFPSLVPVIMKFQAKSPPFHAFKFSDFVTKSMSAVEWWRSHSNVLDSDVISAAQQLLSAVASSSGVEQVFSSYGIVHSKLRNRLGTEKAAKLVFLSKTINAHKMDVYDDTNDQDA